jgi:hypothetical protein
MAVKWKDIAYSVGVNGGVCIACFFIFNILRRLSFLQDFYKAKRKLSIPFRCAALHPGCLSPVQQNLTLQGILRSQGSQHSIGHSSTPLGFLLRKLHVKLS